MSSSSHLMRAVEDFTQSFNKVTDSELTLMKIRDDFIKRVNSMPSVKSSLHEGNPLMVAGEAVEQQLSAFISKCANEWNARKATRELAERFNDKAILLIFGKVNAGKSSLCNYISSLFPEGEVKFFYLDEGKLCYSQESFKEGVTETTARIQGVELCGKLVLLDSPGLHSVTDENGNLTRRFTDSADAVLWLTPSTSPGQVQELDDLKIELESGKPLLPVITRSDRREEDCDEDGNLISILVNKTPENRKEQEEDVHHRASIKLGSKTEVRRPLSISVHAYKGSREQEGSLQASGLANLDLRMAELVQNAANYKPSKARQQVINYLERAVHHSIQGDLLPKINELDQVINKENQALTQRRQETLTKLKQELSEQIADWAEELKINKDRALLASRINTLVTERLATEIRRSVESFVESVDIILVHIDEKDIGEFTDIDIEYSKVTGKALQAAASATGALAGALAGSFFGPVGMAIGGMIGGLAGGAGGEYLVETEVVREQVGVDATQAVEGTLKKLDHKLPEIIDQTFLPWKKTLDMMSETSERIKKEINIFERKLNDAKGKIENEH